MQVFFSGDTIFNNYNTFLHQFSKQINAIIRETEVLELTRIHHIVVDISKSPAILQHGLL